MPPRNKKGCLDFAGMVASGENPNGLVNINPSGNQIGISPRDFVGRQQFGWGGGLHGERHGPIGPDAFMSEAEKKALYGPMPAIPRAPRFKRG